MTAVDFTPEWYRRRRDVRKDRRRRVVYISVLIAVMVGWWMVNRGMIRSARAGLTEAHGGTQQVVTLRSELEKLRQERQRLRAQLQRFRTIAEHVDPTMIIAHISHLLPEQVRLDSVSFRRIDEISSGSRVPARPAGPALAEHTRHSGCMVSVVAQAAENATLLQFCLNAQNAPLFEFADFHDIVTLQVGETPIEQRQIDLYVLRVEHIE